MQGAAGEQRARADRPVRPKRLPDWIVNPLVALFSLAVCALVLEIACRVFSLTGHDEPHLNDPYYYIETVGEVRHHTPFHSYRERIPLRFDTRGYYAPTGGFVWFHSNQFGARWIKPHEQEVLPASVLVVGDSFVYGHSLHYEDTFVYRLQGLLARRGHRVSFLNFAERGADSRRVHDTYRRFQWLTHEMVLYGLHVNDLVNFSTSSAITNLLAFPWLVQRSKGYYFLTERIERHWFRRYKIGRMISSSRFRKRFFTENFDAIVRLRATAAQNGARLVVAVLPIILDLEKGTFSPLYHGIMERLAAHGIDYVDLTTSLSGRSDEDFWVLPFDQHPNRLANEIFAERLAEELDARGWISAGE